MPLMQRYWRAKPSRVKPVFSRSRIEAVLVGMQAASKRCSLSESNVKGMSACTAEVADSRTGDAVVDPRHVTKALASACRKRGVVLHENEAVTRALDDTARLRVTPRHYAYLKISEGCDRLCTFCAIPKMRGKHATKPIEEVIAEAEELAADGVRELIIVAQDTTYYGLDLYGQPRLAELLQKLTPEAVKIDPWQSPQDMSDAIARFKKWWTESGKLPAATEARPVDPMAESRERTSTPS